MEILKPETTVQELAKLLGMDELTENDGVLFVTVVSTDEEHGNVKIVADGMNTAKMLGVAQTIMRFVLSAYTEEDKHAILEAIFGCHSAFLAAIGGTIEGIEDPEQKKTFTEAVIEYLGEDSNGTQEQDASEG